jgi:hypothetical protein
LRFALVLLVLGCLLSVAGAQPYERTINAQPAPTPAHVALEQMTPAERKNSSISVEFESSDGEAVVLGHEIEELWNGGQYDEALARLCDLEARVGHLAIGNSWRRPVPTIETALWGNDIRIGNRDSLLDLAFDLSRRTQWENNLFVVLRHGHGPAYYSVCMSADGGATWAETFTWVGSPVTSLDAGNLGDLYVAYYSPGENAQQVRLRRFQMSDGSAAEFSTGATWVAACTLDVGDTAREVSFVSSGSTWLFISTLVSDGSVLLSESDGAAVSWTRLETGITSGASRGLDATYNLGGSGSWFLLSYLDATDTLRIYGRSISGFTRRLASFCGTSQLTSISAGYDGVVCAYEDASTSPQRVRYASSFDGGNTWTTGMLSDSGIAAEAPAVTVPYSGRSGAVFRHCTPTCELQFCQQTDSGPWSDPVSIADNEPYSSRTGIKTIWVPSGVVFAVAYLSNTSPVVRGAYFVRSDWPIGLAEQRRPQTSDCTPSSTVVRNVLFLRGAASPKPQAASLIDISGRKVLDLRPGHNDVSGLAPGVYFVRSEPSAVSRQPSAVAKVVVTR